MTFNNFNLSASLQEAINYIGFEKPTPIQQQAIPEILASKDVIACAQTGTGKTAAFLLPLIEKVSKIEGHFIKSLILVPTRELAQQIDENLQALSYFTSVSGIAVYGGNQPELFNNQKKALTEGVDIVIATPGRLIAHLNLGYVDFSKLEILILDEADRMLEMGFIADIMKIIKLLPQKRQSLLFSATMATDIRKLALNILSNPVQINLAIAKPAEGVNQKAYLVPQADKLALLEQIITEEDINNMVIFSSRKEMVDEIVKKLRRQKIPCEAMHSNKSQDERNETMRMFKAGKVKIIVATDIISRGIDIDALSHVVNFDVPDDAADYVHRVGRTARAQKTGTAITFINAGKDQLKFLNIEQLIEKELPKISFALVDENKIAYNPMQLLERNKNKGAKNFKKGFKKNKKSFNKNNNK